MKKDLAITILCLALGFSILSSLISLRLYLENRSKITGLERQVYSERLKREYFEWRETNALGHNKSKQDFPRYKELENLSK